MHIKKFKDYAKQAEKLKKKAKKEAKFSKKVSKINRALTDELESARLDAAQLREQIERLNHELERFCRDQNGFIVLRRR